MAKKQDTRAAPASALDRREFLGKGMAFGAAGGLLGGLGLSRNAVAQNAPAPAPA